MIEQRIFSFIVNGQFWKEIEVTDEIIRSGKMVICVMTEIDQHLYDVSYPNPKAKMKQVVFQLAEIAESKNSYAAKWFFGFWVVDDELYFKDGKLYLR